MKPNFNKSVTLFELLVALSLIGVLVLSFSSIELFSRHHVLTSDRRVQTQNEASYVLEHMAKEINRAIGNWAITGQNPLNNTAILGDNATIEFYADYNTSPGNVSFAGDGRRVTENDRWMAYRFNNTTGASARYQIWYCPNCTTEACTTCVPDWNTTDFINNGSVLSKKITAFNITYNNTTDTTNYINVSITACWDPDGSPVACGEIDNPAVNLRARIKMPSVSTR